MQRVNYNYVDNVCMVCYHPSNVNNLSFGILSGITYICFSYKTFISFVSSLIPQLENHLFYSFIVLYKNGYFLMSTLLSMLLAHVRKSSHIIVTHLPEHVIADSRIQVGPF